MSHGLSARLSAAGAAAILGLTCAAPVRADAIDDGAAGRAAILAGHYDEAIALFTRSITSGTLTPVNQAIALNLRGYAYMQKGLDAAALDDLNLSLAKAETPDAHFNRARVLIDQYHYDTAIDDLNRVVVLGAQGADVYALRGHAYLYAGKLDQAVKDLNEAIRQNPNYALAYVTRGHAFMNAGQDDRAIADETKAIALAPKNLEAHWLRAYAWRYHKNAPEKALADYSAALLIDPADGAARDSRADTYEAMGRWADAQADYAAWIRNNPDSSFGYWARGQASLMQGHAAEGAIDLAKAVSLKPSDGYAVIWLHLARRKAGADDQGELQANAARVDTAWPGPVAQYFAGRIDAAAVMARAAQGDGKPAALQTCEAELFLGQDDLDQGRKAQGLERLKAAAKTCDAASREARMTRVVLQQAGVATPKPILASAAPDKSAAPAATATALTALAKPAALARKPARQAAQAQASPELLGLRGSLK